MNITLIGHSTVLIEAAGQTILTDPYFATSSNNPLFQRATPPARRREELLQVDLVLVSHIHFDHIDFPYFRRLPKSTPVVAPALTGRLLSLSGARVRGVFAGQTAVFGGVRVTAVMALHLVETVGYVIEAEGKRVYFAGDTYYGGHLARIGQRFQLNVALLPVTTFAVPMTMNNQGALKAARVLHPEVVIPIHEGLRQGAAARQTPETYQAAVESAGLATKVVILTEGGCYTV